MLRSLSLVSAVFLLTACSLMPGEESERSDDEQFASEPSLDLLGDGWTVDVVRLNGSHYRLELRMRSLVTAGGEGEARSVFLDHADRVAREAGFGEFRVLRYEEGMDSGLFSGRRFARGEIRLVRDDAWGV